MPVIDDRRCAGRGDDRAAGLRLRPRRSAPSEIARRRRRSPASSVSAGRSTSISKARWRSPSRARTATCWSIPRPSIRARCSTSSPRCSACHDNAVTVEVRRMGGGFGGKETQATQWAALAALAAWKTGRPCKIRLDRDDDMIMTGKRHDFRVDYDVGFGKDGVLARRRRDAGGALRLFGGPLARRRRPGHVPRRQRLFLSGACASSAERMRDQHGLEHRLPRLRRPAGHAVRRAHDGPHRLRHRPRSARRAQGAISTAAPAATARPTAWRSRTTSCPRSSPSSSGRSDYWERRASRSPSSTPTARC